MERVKSLIPDDLKKVIAESTSGNLLRSCSSLLDFLCSLPQFQQVIVELTDPEMALCRKSKEKALDFKLKGNECFSKGDFYQALSFYSQALRHIPLTSDDMEANLVATVYINRAFSMHNLGLFEECLRDCNRAIALSPSYAKAWYRRGKVNASLSNHRAAVRDLEIALSMEGTSSGKSNINKELKIPRAKLGSTEGPNISNNGGDDEKSYLADSHDVVLECVSTPTKGRGMASSKDIHPASLLHTEEPLAAIVTKSCRETHCHFCFNEVPADTLFCPRCTIPIYCSHKCQEQAGGEYLPWNQDCSPAENNLTADLAEHFAGVISANFIKDVSTKVNFKHFPEHRHECGGTHWPAVLPSDIILAGRIMAKCIAKRSSEKVSISAETLDLVHHYDQISPASRLEFHIYAVVLSFCLQQYYSSDYPCHESSVAQLVLLICQIKVNSMAIVHMQSADREANFKKDQRLSPMNMMPISRIEQVRVGQAIYSTGSVFNHSCQPNIHAYFLSRTLLIRSTEFVPAWCPLELSYGPQVGQMDILERQKSLEEQYFFKCQCSSCSKLNLSDVVINAFHCPQSNCLGAVVEMTHHKVLGDDFVQVSGASCVCKLSLPKDPNNEDIGNVAIKLLQTSGFTSHIDIDPGYCLNCGSLLDMDSAIATTNNAMTSINRMKDSVILEIDPRDIMSNAMESLSCLKSVRHPYSKAVAQSEDYIAEAFVRIGDLESAMKHCKASIKILEKLYHTKHIVIGHELIKLATIQLSLGDGTSAINSINQVDVVFSLYYGFNMTKRFPYIGFLREQAVILASYDTSI